MNIEIGEKMLAAINCITCGIVMSLLIVAGGIVLVGPDEVVSIIRAWRQRK